MSTFCLMNIILISQYLLEIFHIKLTYNILVGPLHYVISLTYFSVQQKLFGAIFNANGAHTTEKLRIFFYTEGKLVIYYSARWTKYTKLTFSVPSLSGQCVDNILQNFLLFYISQNITFFCGIT